MSESKMTPCPWNCNGNTIAGEIGITASEGENLRHIATLPRLMRYSASGDEYKANAEAIVSAVNNTYGKGIDPESVLPMWHALNNCLQYLKAPGTNGNHFVAEVELALEKAKIK